jgi:hypothetical protein
MPNDAASISMFSDRISRNTTLIALTITFRKAIVIKSKALWGKSKVPLSFEQRKVFFEKCSEAELRAVEVNILIRFYALVPGGT